MGGELKALSDFIKDIGFPAFVVVVLLYQTYHMHSENHRTLDGFRDQLSSIHQLLEDRLPAFKTEQRKQGDPR